MRNIKHDTMNLTEMRYVYFLTMLVLFGGWAAAASPVSAKDGAWQQAYKVRARLVSGGGMVDGGAERDKSLARRLAFVQLELEPGWKTYWRHPGEAGGIPPEFLLQGSTNLETATVLYPAPHRMSEDLGDTIGYKKSVIFPIQLTPSAADQPIDLTVAMKFGICKDICVPTDANFKLTVPQRAAQSLPGQFMAALDAVPRGQDKLRPNDPILQSVNAAQKVGDVWRIGFTTTHRSDAKKADLFLEAPAGLFIPVPKRKTSGREDAPGGTRASVPGGAATAPIRQAYDITLSDEEYQALKGKTLQATVVDGNGASEAEFVLR